MSMNGMLSVCPGCGLVLPSPDDAMDERYNASRACRELSGEVAGYTVSLGDKDFIHQLVVDTYCAQHVGPNVKAIGVAFALIGLLLTYERGYTGRQVQKAHMNLANKTKVWPRFEPPTAKALLTVQDVEQSPPGGARNAMLVRWGKSVWDMWQPEHDAVRALVDRTLFVRGS